MDSLAASLAPESFDLVTSNTAIHHLPLEAALVRMRELLRPGGRLVVVGLGRNAPWDYLLGGFGVVPHRVAVRRRGLWHHPALVRDPAETWGEIRRVARRVLPGARFRRRLYWRYSLTWERPVNG